MAAVLLAAALCWAAPAALAEDIPSDTPAPTAAADTAAPQEMEKESESSTSFPQGEDDPAAQPVKTEEPGTALDPTAEPTEMPAVTEEPETEPTAVPGDTKEPTQEPTVAPEITPAPEETKEPEETSEQPHAGHQLSLRLGSVISAEPTGADAHLVVRVYDLYCQDCGQVVARTDQTETVEESHVFPDDGWRTRALATGEKPGVEYNRCGVCGYEIQRETAPCLHQWSIKSMRAPTCTEAGYLIRVCLVCGAEETLESPEQGHSYEWVNGEMGLREYKCLVCGDVLETTAAINDKLYNNTITSLGPTTRELIGGSVWNRVTPLDVSQEGIFTYPLIASNRYSVGLATVTVEDGMQTVSYVLNSRRIEVHSESLIIYPNLESLRTGRDALAFEFDQPIDLKENFGDDHLLIMGIALKADYEVSDPEIQLYNCDDGQITLMNELID